jgi:pentatricopeptide repeat protein
MSVPNVQQPEFGRRLKRLRTERGLSQRDVAGGVVNPSYISLLESGARVPTLEVAIQLAKSLGVPLGELVDNASDVESVVVEGGAAAGGRLVRDLLARQAYESGDLNGAAQRFEESYRYALSAGNPADALSDGLDLLDVLIRQERHEARARLLDELAGVAEQLGTPEVVVRLQIDRAVAARDTGRMAVALDLAEAAASGICATKLAKTSEHVRALGVLISIYCDSGDFRDVLRLVGEMLDLAKVLASPPVTGRAHWAAAVALGRLGKSDAVEGHVRRARDLLAVPSTSVQDWSRFARGAASALLEADAAPAAVEYYLTAARAAYAITATGSAQLASLECRFALMIGEHERAVELSEFVDGPEVGLVGVELARLRRARGFALRALGRRAEAAAQIRAAAVLCDEIAAHRMAAQMWRELAEMNS